MGNSPDAPGSKEINHDQLVRIVLEVFLKSSLRDMRGSGVESVEQHLSKYDVVCSFEGHVGVPMEGAALRGSAAWVVRCWRAVAPVAGCLKNNLSLGTQALS